MTLNVVVIDYGLGNVHSAKQSTEKAIEQTNKKGVIKISSNYTSLKNASHIILPGQGAFESCLKGLLSLKGLINELKEQIFIKKKPLLGICVGMQLLANESFENGTHEGLGLIDGSIIKIPTEKLKLPHMGWNEIAINNNHKILNGISNNHFYFVHSYYFKTKKIENVIASTNYEINFPAIIAKDNIFGTQFHPEKSSNSGIKLLSNFLLL